MNSLDQVVNLKVRITNLLDESVTGYIYTFSAKQRVLALKLNGNGPKNSTPGETTFRIINTSFIKSIQVVPPYNKKSATTYDNAPPQRAGNLNIEHLEAELNRVIKNTHANEPEIQKKPATPLALKVCARLEAILGKENVHLQSNESILLFKEVAVSKPYALNKISNGKRTQTSKHLEKVRSALREVWMSPDNSRRGG